MANELKCPECHEGQMAVPAVKASLEKEEQLWRTLQMDTFHLKYEGFTYHFLLMLDEASGFSVVHLVMYHLSDEHANITSAQVIDTLQRCWGQYFGLPERIRCDLEGSFRGEMVEDFCHSRGIELSFVPAEHHESTGDVERMIGELKKKMSHHLRNEVENTSPEQAAWQMCAAHNRVARVGGYSPAQWALGRDLEERDNLAIQTAQGDPASEMSHNLQARLRAEATYRKLQSDAKISRGLNSRPQRSTQFLPGDLVYFRRWKVPAHAYLDSPSMKVARFYGPARVLAAETKLQSDGLTRASTNIIWIIAGSKLKKAHSSQLRHASERERLEDLTKEPKKTRTSATTRTATPSGHRSRSRGPRVRAEPSEVPGPSQVPPDAQQAPAEESEEELIPAGHDAPPDLSAEQGLDQILQNPPPDIDAQRLLEDPSYMPLEPLEKKDFNKLRRDHEQAERPLHVKYPKKNAPSEAPSPALWTEAMGDYFVLGVIIDAPANESEWKRVLKNPSKFAAKSVQKGAEVAWQKLNPEQKKAMGEAKHLEVSQWVSKKVCERFRAAVPAGRLMKTRWVLTLCLRLWTGMTAKSSVKIASSFWASRTPTSASLRPALQRCPEGLGSWSATCPRTGAGSRSRRTPNPPSCRVDKLNDQGRYLSNRLQS